MRRRTLELEKFARPRLHSAVRRERLFRLLDQARARRCAVCVLRPPGACRTTVVANWLNAARHQGDLVVRASRVGRVRREREARRSRAGQSFRATGCCLHVDRDGDKWIDRWWNDSKMKTGCWEQAGISGKYKGPRPAGSCLYTDRSSGAARNGVNDWEVYG